MALFGFGKDKNHGKEGSASEEKVVPLCMWKSTKDDPDFSRSDIIPLLDSIFQLSEGNELMFFNGTVSAFGGKGNLKRMPDEEIIFGPLISRDVPFVISLSKEKGLRFHFDYGWSDHREIKSLLEEFASLMKNNPAVLEKKRYNKPTNGVQWWAKAKQVANANFKEVAVGQISFPLRPPSTPFGS